MKRFLVLLFVLSLESSIAQRGAANKKDPKAKQVAWETVTQFQAKPLAEISGLAASPIQPGVFWAHNDSGGEAALYAVNVKGDLLGSAAVAGVKNKDWEDLAAFQHQGKSYLLIGDVGDNGKKRPQVSLHVIPEPKALANGRYDGVQVHPEWTITLRYEDGPQDCESIAVDASSKRVFLLNKDGKASVVYQVPLLPATPSNTLIAKQVATLPQTANASSNVFGFVKAGLLGSRATGMDLSTDGRTAVILTYTDIRLFNRGAKQSWEEAFLAKPVTTALPSIYQPEAICMSADNDWVYVSSEETPTPFVRCKLNEVRQLPQE